MKNRKEDLLDPQHWRFQDYKQRIPARAWRRLLLNDDDKIIFKGRVVKLLVKRLGFGVVEVSKEIISDDTNKPPAETDRCGGVSGRIFTPGGSNI